MTNKDYKTLARFVVEGVPVPLKRHRDTTIINRKTGKANRVKYDPSSEDKKNFLLKCLAATKPPKVYDVPLRLVIVFFMPRPKSHYGTGKNAGKLKDSAPVNHTSKPDLDNLIKFVKDALNGKYWTDDSIISTVIATKVYSNEPKTRIIIKQDFLT